MLCHFTFVCHFTCILLRCNIKSIKIDMNVYKSHIKLIKNNMKLHILYKNNRLLKWSLSTVSGQGGC